MTDSLIETGTDGRQQSDPMPIRRAIETQLNGTFGAVGLADLARISRVAYWHVKGQWCCTVTIASKPYRFTVTSETEVPAAVEGVLAKAQDDIAGLARSARVS